MATPVVTPNSTQSELSVFVHKVLYAHVGVLILLLALMGAEDTLACARMTKPGPRGSSANAVQYRTGPVHGITEAAHRPVGSRFSPESTRKCPASQPNATDHPEDTKTPAPAVQTALQPSASILDVVLGLQTSYSDAPSFGPVTPPRTKGRSECAQAQAVVVSHESESVFQPI